jgi:hypothetical protein
MANTPFNGNEVALEYDISLTDTPDWEVIGCVTDTDLDTSRDTIDANSKCGDATLAGTATFTANFTIFYNKTPDAGQLPYTTLASLNYNGNGDVKHWRIIHVDDPAVIYREFRGSITSFNETFNNNDVVGATATISIVGGVISVAPTT